MSLDRLIAEAVVLGGGQHQCAALGHVWIALGGRQCPRGAAMESQTVYVCQSCGWEDYGEPGGPGHRDCFDLGPCDYRCEATTSDGGVEPR